MAAQKRSAPRKKVVVVDDEILIRETVRLALEHAGLAATAVSDPDKALAMIRAEKPDLVLMDLYMPGLDGRELLRAMKADPALARVPVLVFSGSNEAVDVVTGLQSGAVDYLAKPADGDMLVAKIRSILNLPPAP
jgi:DNA-binding response OmpR family regulator